LSADLVGEAMGLGIDLFQRGRDWLLMGKYCHEQGGSLRETGVVHKIPPVLE
jgi:hypothetical protein